MAKKKNLLTAPAVIESHLALYAKSTSDLHKGIRKRLKRLQISTQKLDQLVSDRRGARAAAEAEFASQADLAAKNALEGPRRFAAAREVKGSNELGSLSASFLKLAELQAEQILAQKASFKAATAIANESDDLVRRWTDNLVVESVKALRDDAALDKALAIVSGGLILAGATGGTSVAIGAAIGSAILLAREIKERLTKEGRTSRRDRDVLREELAGKLLKAVADLGDEINEILRVRAVVTP